MDANERIRQLLTSRGWSEYKLAKEAGLSQSTISNLFRRNTVPSIPTLETLCKGFGITLAQFFAQGEFVELSPEQQELFAQWVVLSPQQKHILHLLIQDMSHR